MTLSEVAVASAHEYGIEALQSHLPPLSVAIPVLFWRIVWPPDSFTEALALQTTTPFFGTAEDAVIVKLNTKAPVVGAAGANSAFWAQRKGATQVR
jgi:hypothetical protein